MNELELSIQNLYIGKICKKRIFYTLLKLVYLTLDHANFTISPCGTGLINESLQIELTDTIVLSSGYDHSPSRNVSSSSSTLPVGSEIENYRAESL